MFAKALANVFGFGLVVVLWGIAAVLALVLVAPVPIAAYMVSSTWVLHEAANGRAGEPGVVVRAWPQPQARWVDMNCKGEFRLDGKTRTVVAGFANQQRTTEAEQCPVPTHGRLVHLSLGPTQVVKDGSTEWRTQAYVASLPVLWTLGLAWLAFRWVRRRLRGPRSL